MTERQIRPEAPATADVLVNVGCGDQPLPGFVNLDLDRDADLKLDVRRGLPFADGTVDGIHSEHFVEHLTQGELLAFLRECRRALRPGGVVRVATPDLAEIVRCYVDPDWHERCGLKDYGYDWLANPCEMLNVCLRDWGHQHVVDAVELKRLARLAGLAEPAVCATGESRWPFFRGVESRLGRHLVMEFRRPAPAPRPASGPPLVSVLIAAYEPRWFEAALLSARRQTHAHLEILVGDDSPGDEIAAVCLRHAAGDPRVSYVRNPSVLGEIDNWQALYERARGDYVKCLADDDLLEPDVRRAPGRGARRQRRGDPGRLVPPADRRRGPRPARRLQRAAGRDRRADPRHGPRRPDAGRPPQPDRRAHDLPLPPRGRRRRPAGPDVLRRPPRPDQRRHVPLVPPAEQGRPRCCCASRSAPSASARRRPAAASGTAPTPSAPGICWARTPSRLGLWSGAAPAGGRIAARPLVPPPPPAPEVSLLLPAAGDLPAMLRGLAALAAEKLPTALEYVVADVGLSARGAPLPGARVATHPICGWPTPRSPVAPPPSTGPPRRRAAPAS